MTALYLLARYFGSLYVIIHAYQLDLFRGCDKFAVRMAFLLSLEIRVVYMYLATAWAENIFILTMQAILVVRVYALFNRSKMVLVFLATSYVLQATATFVMTGLIDNKRLLDRYFTSVRPAIGSVAQAISQNFSAFPNAIDEDGAILSMVFDTILLLFALWAFLKHALEAQSLDGRWSINVLVRTLVADHLLYFVCACNTGLNSLEVLLGEVSSIFGALLVILGPRMVISLRTTENKTRGEGGTLEGEVSTIRFGIQEPPIQSESVMEEGGGFREADEDAHID
ncbi:hypothetical protein BJ138DRAFT_1104489 [Hygrophoropsis aurantiaca]|uniref:Uncharacterized protein n=1 Tax=Hygrophoropsis aurantiaca TaxID=72124 RepID=A0ACB8A1K6_9AGAM|nr:hypothetical protein BJ138DRAFT_1104489 [Hygrophoropsis aurantiaca]